MKVFLDVGAYDGMSAEFFRRYHPQGNEFKIYSFECDKRNIEKLRKRTDITLIEKAVWVNDGKMAYFYGKDDGGSLYGTKNTGGISQQNRYEVDAIDLGRWIRMTFTDDDYIILKLNVEGVEYDIIPHLNTMNLLPWIDKWFIQWHYEKVGISKEKHDYTHSLISWYPWECQLGFESFAPKFLKAL